MTTMTYGPRSGKPTVNGGILWEGASLLDGKPIVVIATGLKQSSANDKTGSMIQTWIIRSDMLPMEAIRSGEDESICGDCSHRGNGDGKQRSCYVKAFQAPTEIWKAYKKGTYPRLSESDVERCFTNQAVRLGAYGDPAAVPLELWEKLVRHSRTWTGYTHQWKKLGPEWAKLLMASADTPSEMEQAHSEGWRTFRVTINQPPVDGVEIICPASEEAGKLTTCADCSLCKGTSSGAKSIVIKAHGAGKKHTASFAV